MELTISQKEKIKEYLKEYHKWDEKEKNIVVHREHQAFFQKKLSLENIDRLTEEDFREIYKTLWASNIWGNKDWYIDHKLLEPNSLAKIKDELKKLLYGQEDIEKRFDNFKESVKGFGISSLSEILHFVFPSKYCLWNDKPKTVLPFMNIKLLPEKFFRYNISTGDEYKQCIKTLDLIRDELKSNGFKNPDFIDVDCFLWFVFEEIFLEQQEGESEEQLEEKVKPLAKINSHEEAEYYLLELGELLGYSTYTADGSIKYNGKSLSEKALLKEIPDFAGVRDKNSAREIDVIWFDDAENPIFCLEVENSTDITKGLNRLLQLEHFHVKFVIVAPEEKRSKFGIEMSKFPYRKMKDRYFFISYEELVELYESVAKYKQLRGKLLGE